MNCKGELKKKEEDEEIKSSENFLNRIKNYLFKQEYI